MNLRMSTHQLIQEINARIEVIASTAAGTAYGVYQAHTSNNIGATIISFGVDTAIHLTQGCIVGIGTYLAVHYFKKLFHKTKTK